MVYSDRLTPFSLAATAGLVGAVEGVVTAVEMVAWVEVGARVVPAVEAAVSVVDAVVSVAPSVGVVPSPAVVVVPLLGEVVTTATVVDGCFSVSASLPQAVMLSSITMASTRASKRFIINHPFSKTVPFCRL